MTEFNLLGDNTEWQKDFERRLHASYTAAGPGATAAEHMLEDVRASISDWTVAEITDAGTRVGYVGVVVADDNGTLAGRIGDLRVDALHAGRPHEQAARDRAEGWCAERGAHRLDIRLNARSHYESFTIVLTSQGQQRATGADPRSRWTAAALDHRHRGDEDGPPAPQLERPSLRAANQLAPVLSRLQIALKINRNDCG